MRSESFATVDCPKFRTFVTSTRALLLCVACLVHCAVRTLRRHPDERLPVLDGSAGICGDFPGGEAVLQAGVFLSKTVGRKNKQTKRDVCDIMLLLYLIRSS